MSESNTDRRSAPQRRVHAATGAHSDAMVRASVLTNPRVLLIAALIVVAALAAFFAVSALTQEDAATRVYEYRIQSQDGQVFTVRETAEFGDDGYLDQSSLSITVPDQESGQAILAQMEKSFGDRLLIGDAADKTVVLVVKPTRDNMDASTYDDLMKQAAS